MQVSHVLKYTKAYLYTVLAVQWLRLHLQCKRVQVQPLVWELRPHMPLDPKNQNIKETELLQIQ